MSRAQLFIRNALACEHATHPKCECACGGRFHGQQHPATFFVAGLAKIKQDALSRDPQRDLFGVATVAEVEQLMRKYQGAI